ncbi:MAG: tail fiber protein [Verrucomicrobia bacterium]|nr:tail fiber protein [Verrucomicrobiota bacterium]
MLIVAIIAPIIAVIVSLVTAGLVSSHTRADVRRMDSELRSVRDSVQGTSRADAQRLDTELRPIRESLQGISRADIQRLDNELRSVRDSVQGVSRADIQHLNNEVASMRDSLQGVTKADFDRLNNELASLRDSLQGVTKADLQGLSNELVSLRESVQRANGEDKGRLDDLVQRVNAAENRLRPFQDEVERLRGRAADASKDLNEARSQYQQAHQVINDFQIIIRNYDAVLTVKEAEFKGMVKDLENNVGALVLEQMPIGSILMWPLTEKPPAKWRICDGQPVTSQEGPEFCQLFRDAYWTTDGGKAVHVPDLRGYFIRGADTRKSGDPDKIDEDAPREVGSKQAEKLPQHTHDVSDVRVAGGLGTEQSRNLFAYQTQRREQLRPGSDVRTFPVGSGEAPGNAPLASAPGGGAASPNPVQAQAGVEGAAPSPAAIGGGETPNAPVAPVQTQAQTQPPASGADAEVDAMALRGDLGPMIKQQGKLRPDNIALQFIIRVQR